MQVEYWKKRCRIQTIISVTCLVIGAIPFFWLHSIKEKQAELRLLIDAKENALSKMPFEERPDIPQEIKDYIKNDHIMQDKLIESGTRRKECERQLEECRASKGKP